MKFLLHIWSIYLRFSAQLPILRTIVPFIPLLIAWTLVTELAFFPRAFLPGPMDVIHAFGTLTYRGVLTQYLEDSVVRLAVGAAFGMEVVTWSPRMTPERAAAENAKAVSLEELLSTSKIVSMHLVAGPGTKGLISADQLALMRPDSILVNTSRAALINMSDLQKALAAGRPGQAAIDVFDIEPLPTNDPLRNTPNLLVTPHLGFIAEPIFAAFSKGITDTLEAWIDNKPLPHPFKPQ